MLTAIYILFQSFLGANETQIDLDTVGKKTELIINKNKNKVMMQTRKRAPSEQSITIAEYNFRNIDSFAYLGSKLKLTT